MIEHLVYVNPELWPTWLLATACAGVLSFGWPHLKAGTMTDKPLMTQREAAARLGVSPRTIARGIAAGTIPTVTVVTGGRRWIPAAWVHDRAEANAKVGL